MRLRKLPGGFCGGHHNRKAASVSSVVDFTTLQDAFCIDPYPILHLLYQLRPTGFIQPY